MAKGSNVEPSRDADGLDLEAGSRRQQVGGGAFSTTNRQVTVDGELAWRKR